MISSVELYLDEEWQDVTPYLQKNDISRQDRCDDVFATGLLQLRYNRSTNIPPYTPLRINGTELWFAKSTCTRYLTKENYYIHDVELLELTAILSCYILGSKNFSVTGTNKIDYQKIQIITYLMEQKYGISFELESYLFLGKEQEFTFGPGTTMFDALLEIAKSYDGVKVKVNSYDPVINKCIISFQQDRSEYSLNEQRILEESYFQDTDSYGSILESEMTNIIDRTNTTIVRDLTPRTDEFRMDLQNSSLILPTRCERVVDFGISSGVATLAGSITLGSRYNEALKKITRADVYAKEQTKPFKEWYAVLKEPLDYFLNSIVEGIYHLSKDYIINTDWDLRWYPEESYPWDAEMYAVLHPKGSGYQGVDDTYAYGFTGLPGNWSLRDRILPKNKWLLLEDRDKPKYVYYESGSNKIEGLDSYYKNDFWNNILGNTVGPFLSNLDFAEKTYSKLDDSIEGSSRVTEFKFSYELAFSGFKAKSLLYSYWVEYYPIIDLAVRSNKKIVPNNESAIKQYAKSYDKNSNYIDFDRLMDSLQLTNDMMGLPEGTIEYKLAPDEAAPKAFQRINRDGKEWTIASVVLKSYLNKEVATINLVHNYNKVADAIGVKTQFNETKNPLNNIIDRAVFWETDGSSIPGICNECWAKILIADKTVYKRCAITENDKTVYVYIEALDQYSFDKQAIATDNSDITDTYYCKDISYCDENNEAVGASISLGLLQNLTREESLNLPLYQGDKFVELIDLGYRLLYKDARERLLFTIKLNNCNVVPISATTWAMLHVTTDEGVESWTARRIQSHIGETGELKQNDFCYIGDIIDITIVAKTGYGVVGGFWHRITVGEIDIKTDKLLNIFIQTEQKRVGLDPIVSAEISKDSSGMFDQFLYTIENPNTVPVTATVNIYLHNGERYDSITHEIGANESHLNGFETQRDITNVEVEFHSSLFSNTPSVQCQVLRK